MATTGSLSNPTPTRKDGVRVDEGIEPGDDHMRVHHRVTSSRDDPNGPSATATPTHHGENVSSRGFRADRPSP